MTPDYQGKPGSLKNLKTCETVKTWTKRNASICCIAHLVYSSINFNYLFSFLQFDAVLKKNRPNWLFDSYLFSHTHSVRQETGTRSNQTFGSLGALAVKKVQNVKYKVPKQRSGIVKVTWSQCAVPVLFIPFRALAASHTPPLTRSRQLHLWELA